MISEDTIENQTYWDQYHVNNPKLIRSILKSGLYLAIHESEPSENLF